MTGEISPSDFLGNARASRRRPGVKVRARHLEREELDAANIGSLAVTVRDMA